MENITNLHPEIKGWGIDIDLENEPTYPMKKYTGDDHKRINYDRPKLQEQTVEMLHSNERPSLSAVYGTSAPPSGLSGRVRRHAFRYSENHYGHWFTLVLADRINVIEGIVADIKSGKFPNILAEKGFKAQWKYNKKEVLVKAFAYVAVTAAIILLAKRKRLRSAY